MKSIKKEVKTNWGDDVDDFEQDVTEKDEDGIFTVVEERVRDDGKKVKVTRKIKKKLVKEAVNHVVAERKKLKKFGKSKNDPSGPQEDTTNISEEIFLKLSSNNKEGIKVEEPKEKVTPSNIVCRYCKGEHWTIKCPFKNSMLSERTKLSESRESMASSLSNDDSKPGKYIPPSLRNRMGSGRGEGDKPQYDDENTIRITNISEDTTDRDLNELIHRFGPTNRVFLKRDKGYAFVNFVRREDAERALNTLNGYGYDSLILHVEWSNRNKN
jgi:translation initiation factor 3 subunit G